MTLLTVLLWLVAVEFVAISAAAVIFVGRERLHRTVADLPDRLRSVAGPVGFLAVVLLVNAYVRELVPEVSWLVGINITPTIYALEGRFVADLQSFATPWLTVVFSFVYIYGYVFLLVFPLLAYTALDDRRPLRVLVVAYGLNYALGLVCYVVFIAYGPRNLLAGSVESLLYTAFPEFQLLTSRVNTNTNVFPSLHTSLSATVAILAARTRETYGGWFAVATALALAVVVATMYLGIHWATDVVAGVALAVLSVGFADLLTKWRD